MVSKKVFVVTAFLLGEAFRGSAATLTVGSYNDFEDLPFTFLSSQLTARYQQVYSSSAFAGPVIINAFSFSRAPRGGLPFGTAIDEGTYSASFSTTPAAVNGLNPQFDSNVGIQEQQFATLTLTQTLYNVPDPIVFTAVTPYAYDPTAGNLLLDIAISNLHFPGSSRDYGHDFMADNSGSVVSRATSTGTYRGDVADSIGLVTDFSVQEVPATTPEPRSGLLLLSGILLSAFFKLRKSRKKRLE